MLQSTGSKSQTWLSDWTEVKVTQLCLTLCNPIDSTVHGILQARILEWVAFPFSKGSSQFRGWTQASRIAGRFFTSWATYEVSPRILEWAAFPFSSRSSLLRNPTGVSCITGGSFTNWAIREAPNWTETYPNSNLQTTMWIILLKSFLDQITTASLLRSLHFAHWVIPASFVFQSGFCLSCLIDHGLPPCDGIF